MRTYTVYIYRYTNVHNHDFPRLHTRIYLYTNRYYSLTYTYAYIHVYISMRLPPFTDPSDTAVKLIIILVSSWSKCNSHIILGRVCSSRTSYSKYHELYHLHVTNSTLEMCDSHIMNTLDQVWYEKALFTKERNKYCVVILCCSSLLWNFHIHTHTHIHKHIHTNAPTHTHTNALTHTRTHAHTHLL